MHRINAMSGEWNPLSDGVTFVEQTPADLVLLTAADTDIQTLAAVVPKLPAQFPTFRVANLLQLQHQISIDAYAEEVLEFAQIIIIRLLGGRSYWAYGLEVIQEIVQRKGTTLILMPGDDILDAELINHSTLPLTTIHQIWRYFHEGGRDNIIHALQFITDTCLSTTYNPPAPLVIPRVGVYEWRSNGEKEGKREGVGAGFPRPEGRSDGVIEGRSKRNNIAPHTPHTSHILHTSHTPHTLSKVGIIFYRAHYLASNTKVIDALCAALVERNLEPVPVFVSSLREVDVQEDLIEFFQPKEETPVSLILNTTSFSVARLDTQTPQIDLWQKLDVPVLQVILSSGSQSQWESQWQGLSPRDIAMNVALPEVDGRIISRAVSFKALETRNQDLETDVVIYQPVSDRIDFVANLTANWVKLRDKLPPERRVALILANYPTRNGRLANGVGLDTPASCVEILKALQAQGYSLENIPPTGDDLIEILTSGVTNDPEARELRPILQSVSLWEYTEYFQTLPLAVQQAITQRWGTPNEISPSSFPISGIQLGNIFIGIQPARGYDIDPSLNYHAPDLEPTHEYLGFYYWIRECFGADAVIHVGKHGNLEWLPGKSITLSSDCYPEIALGALPHLYPFIVNDPGEGSQAKRRAQAVIIDHLTPPLTRAELYGSLQNLENLIDEYYEAESLDPSRLPAISDRIQELILQENLNLDLGLKDSPEDSPGELAINKMDGYLCELKEAQIRDGLHIFGQCPQQNQLRDLIVAIARQPNPHHIGITRALAADLGLDFDPLTDDFSTKLSPQNHQLLLNTHSQPCRTIGDAVELLENQAAILVQQTISVFEEKAEEQGAGSRGRQEADEQASAVSVSRTGAGSQEARSEGDKITNCQPSTVNYQPSTLNSLNWINHRLLPALQQTHREITNLLRGLDGKYIPSAPAGAPTRGRPEVLPTGNNFYSVDIRALPTETAWDVGRKAAEALIERYAQENGEYPKTLGLSMWGTATMRTGGDDMAEALALLGVQPVWDGVARRVVDFEILPLTVLGRPRVDVTLRISGFFRDAFANLIDLFHRAVVAVAALDEPEKQNPLAAKIRQETEFWTQQGLDLPTAKQRSQYRIFGSKPGAYGAGLQGLIESQNWIDDEDLARAYINWSCYAYSTQEADEHRAGSQEARSEEDKITNHQPSTVNHQPSTINHQPSTINHQPSTVNHQPSTVNRQPSTINYQPSWGKSAPEAFERRLQNMEIVLHNQDNREHDLLDSDDYYQFQGGLTAAVRSAQGKNPQIYFGDHSLPSKPRIRRLTEEIARVYRSRVVNPKWIAGVMRHGYKGAFEMAATVDYLFAYDATTKCVEDYMYQGIVQAYLLDPDTCQFIERHNPYALRDIAERILEANQRGLWQDVDIETLETLRSLVHQAEAAIEAKTVV